jgi:hypothetical protein
LLCYGLRSELTSDENVNPIRGLGGFLMSTMSLSGQEDLFQCLFRDLAVLQQFWMVIVVGTWVWDREVIIYL